MENRSAILLAFGACGAGFLSAWLIFRSDGTCKVEEPAPSQGILRVAQEVRSSPAVPDLEPPDGRVPISTEAEKQPEMLGPAIPSMRLSEKDVRDMFDALRKAPKPASPDPRGLPERTPGEMAFKLNAINGQIYEATQPSLAQRFHDGLSSHWSDDPVCPGVDSDADRATIYGFQLAANGVGWDRTVLPRWQYPELYALKDDALRIEKLLSETEAAEKKAAANR